MIRAAAIHRRPRRCLIASCSILAAGLPLSASAQAGDQDPRHITQRNCFTELAHGTSETFVCDYPAWLTDAEKADLKRITREYVQDASCRVSVKIERRLVMQGLAAETFVFQAPPQPVQCEVWTQDAMVPISGTFAPRVVFKDGAAVEATPGLGNITGVSKYLAWPVLQYVNRSPSIQAEMIKMINDYRSITARNSG